MIKAIIFDFDGVILETNDIKAEGFVYLFRRYPVEIQEKVRKLYLENGGVSRYRQFETIYRGFLKKSLDEKTRKRLSRELTKFCYQRILEAPFVGGMKEFLDWAKERFDLFIVSGTPQQEIRKIVGDIGLYQYFKGIYGSPATKKEICSQILRENKLKGRHLIFIGDALSDYEGARKNRIPFVARIHRDNRELFKNKKVIKVKDFVRFTKNLPFNLEGGGKI